MELTKIWEVIRRRKWIILQALIVVTLVTVMGSYLIKPSYEASSKVLVMPFKKGAGLELGKVGLPSLTSIITTITDLSVNKVLAVSRPYMEKLVSRLQLRDRKGQLISSDKLTQSEPVFSFKEIIFPQPRIGIREKEETNLLNIRGVSSNSEEAMMMANTLAQIMVDENQENVRAEYRHARIFIEGQISEVKEQYNKALLKLTEFRKKEETLDLRIETRLAAEKTAELLKEKEDNIIDLAEARAKLGRLKEQLAKEKPGFLSASTLQENPHIDVLKKRLTELRLQLAQARSDLTERHPQVLSLNEQIKIAEAELEKEIEVYRSSAPELTQLERRIASLEAHLTGVNADMDKYFAAFGELPDKVYKQTGLDMELNVSQQRYSALLDSLHRVEMAEASTLSEIRVVEPAVRPIFPESPNKTKNGLLGVFVGLAFGLGLAFVAEYQDDRIRTTEDAKELRHIALMGLVPVFEPTKQPLISTKDPDDPLCECYRKIRNYPSIEDGSVKSLLITSPGPNEAKPTTVVNLGISIAHERKQVVLIDMDLRRPSLHAYFNLPNHVGMTDILQGESSLDEAIQATSVEGLSIISSGPPFPDAGVLIESGEVGSLLSELTTRFDMVIMDSAPVLVKSDPLVLAKHVDGSIIVIESERTTRRAARELVDILANAHIKPLGFILNKFSMKKGKQLYHQYYYGYGGRELLVSERG
ncbi:MAG: polysaccharide biosynthesis tyrosine autokinase [Desulfobacterales bacterium]|nr:MAG: polysaccharide biosynthesis tyrosine autokinase [Desulfobacterales bacterium]